MNNLPESGILFDGAYGYDFNAQRVIALAEEYGGPFDAGKTLEGDQLNWEEESATQYLNDLAPEGMAFYWDDGDYFYQSVEEEKE